MKRCASFLLACVLGLVILTGCCGIGSRGYSEAEKKKIAREEIEDLVWTAISTNSVTAYGTADVDIHITSFEEDENTKITITEGDIEAVAYRVIGTYEIAGVITGDFEGVYTAIFSLNSRGYQVTRNSLDF